MPEQLIHHLMGKALTEPAFREALLQRPREAIRRFEFTERERDLIASVQAGSLEEFARQLNERLGEEVQAARNGNGRNV